MVVGVPDRARFLLLVYIPVPRSLVALGGWGRGEGKIVKHVGVAITPEGA